MKITDVIPYGAPAQGSYFPTVYRHIATDTTVREPRRTHA